jgi:hypothetical protein
MPHELKLSKKQYNALVRDVHSDMMKGSGLTDDTYAPPATIPDFSGPDLGFFVEDSGMEGGGWRDTLSSVWNSVKKHVLSNPLAGKVVNAGINKGAQLARSAADAAVGKALNYVPSEFRGSAQALANKGLDSLENKAEGAARQFARDQGVTGAGLYQSGAMNGSGLVMAGSGTPAISGMGNGRMAQGTHVVSPYNHLTAKGSY